MERWLEKHGRVVEWVKVVTETDDVYPVVPGPPLVVHHLPAE